MSFYVLSKAGDTFINVESFEYVYVADDDTIKAIAGQRMVRLGKYTNRECAEAALQMLFCRLSPAGGVYRMPTDDEAWSAAAHARPKAPDKFAANGKKPPRHGGS
jgi:hypothetical protein